MSEREFDYDALPDDDRELISALSEVIAILVATFNTEDDAISTVAVSERGGPAAVNVLRFALAQPD